MNKTSLPPLNQQPSSARHMASRIKEFKHRYDHSGQMWPSISTMTVGKSGRPRRPAVACVKAPIHESRLHRRYRLWSPLRTQTTFQRCYWKWVVPSKTWTICRIVVAAIVIDNSKIPVSWARKSDPSVAESFFPRTPLWMLYDWKRFALSTNYYRSMLQ